MERLQLQLMSFAITIIQTLTLRNCIMKKRKGAISSDFVIRLTAADFDGIFIRKPQKTLDISVEMWYNDKSKNNKSDWIKSRFCRRKNYELHYIQFNKQRGTRQSL